MAEFSHRSESPACYRLAGVATAQAGSTTVQSWRVKFCRPAERRDEYSSSWGKQYRKGSRPVACGSPRQRQGSASASDSATINRPAQSLACEDAVSHAVPQTQADPQLLGPAAKMMQKPWIKLGVEYALRAKRVPRGSSNAFDHRAHSREQIEYVVDQPNSGSRFEVRPTRRNARPSCGAIVDRGTVAHELWTCCCKGRGSRAAGDRA